MVLKVNTRSKKRYVLLNIIQPVEPKLKYPNQNIKKTCYCSLKFHTNKVTLKKN